MNELNYMLTPDRTAFFPLVGGSIIRSDVKKKAGQVHHSYKKKLCRSVGYHMREKVISGDGDMKYLDKEDEWLLLVYKSVVTGSNIDHHHSH